MNEYETGVITNVRVDVGNNFFGTATKGLTAILPLNEAIVCVISNGFKQQPHSPLQKHTHTPWREREREKRREWEKEGEREGERKLSQSSCYN